MKPGGTKNKHHFHLNFGIQNDCSILRVTTLIIDIH